MVNAREAKQSKAKQSKLGRAAFGLLIAAALVQATEVRASTFVPLRASGLANVELIVRAVATDVDPVGHYDPNGLPCTVVRMNVVEVIKGGDRTSTLEFCSLGGIQADGRLSIPIGVPAFNQGDTYVLFMKTTGWTILPIANGTLGVLREVQDGDRQILVSADGFGVINIDDDGIQVGARVEKPEQIRLLQTHGIPMDVVTFDDTTGLRVSDAEMTRRRDDGRRACPAREILEAQLRTKLPPESERVLHGVVTPLEPYSAPLSRQEKAQ